MTNLTHSKIATIATSKWAKKDESHTAHKYRRSFDQMSKGGLGEFYGLEYYECVDTNKNFVKPHFEIDAPWINNTIDHKRRDEIVLNAVTFITALFDADLDDVCVLYDEKDSKCSLHFNLANTFTSMSELIKMKRALNQKLKELHFDIDAVYCNGFTKFRTLYSHKMNGLELIGKGLQKLAYPELNIFEHQDIDYFVYSMTDEHMIHWTFNPDSTFASLYPECADAVKAYNFKQAELITAPQQPPSTSAVTGSDSSSYNERVTDTVTAQMPASSSTNEFSKNVINEMIDIVLKNKSKDIHTHTNITTTAKGLVNSGFKAEAERLVMNCMNTKNKDMCAIWNDCLTNAHNTKRTANSLFHLAKTANLKEFNVICAKNGRTQLPPHIYNDLFTLKHGVSHKFNERYLPNEIIDIIQQNQTTFIKSHLGTGKTTIMKKLISLYPKKNILYFSPRIAFAKQVVSEIDGFVFYGDLKADSGEDIKKKIVIQMESLWKVSGVHYDIIIIDEIESCLKQLSCVDTMKFRILENHKLFQKIITSAEKVVCCDAFLSNKSIEVIGMISSSAQEVRKTATIVNEYNPYSRKAIELSNDEALLKHLTSDLKQGKKCVFVCGSKSKASAFVIKLNQTLPNKNIKFYYGNMDDTEKDFSNVNEMWADLDLLIYTPVITCGVNYDPETPTFDRLYVYGTPHSACVRDVFQATLRIRNLKDNVMFYAISKTKNNRETYPVGFLENYELIQKNKEFVSAFVSEQGLTPFGKVDDWVLWNYAYNKNEEGVKLEYYQSAFYDYLKVCGYENTRYTKHNDSAKVEGVSVDLNSVEPITSHTYSELKNRYYDLYEEQKNSMRLFEYEMWFDVDSDMWDLLEKNKQLTKNIPCEFSLKTSEVIEKENVPTIDIYAENTFLKMSALKQLNKILDAPNTLSVKYSNNTIVEKTEELKSFIDHYSGLFLIRKPQSKSKGISTRYLNSVIQSIYEEWNGCPFVRKDSKTSCKGGGTRKKITEYKNDEDGKTILNKIKIDKRKLRNCGI